MTSLRQDSGTVLIGFGTVLIIGAALAILIIAGVAALNSPPPTRTAFLFENAFQQPTRPTLPTLPR